MKDFKLIEGTFSKVDAHEMLMELINSKIHFHDVKNFSSNERTGKVHDISVQRIQILKQLKTEITQKLSELNEDVIFHIEAEIKITFPK